ARHHHFDRAPRLFRKQHSQRLEIDPQLTAKAAPNLRRDNLNIAFRYLEQMRHQTTDREDALGRAVDRHMMVGVIEGNRVMRLDVALVDAGGTELAFDNEVGGGEPRLDIAALDLDMSRDVARSVWSFIDAR